jgi:small ligand-binding sensory domain FIST
VRIDSVDPRRATRYRPRVLTYVASSTSTSPVDAVLDIAARLRAQGLEPARAAAAFGLCFVAQALIEDGASSSSPSSPPSAPGLHSALHAALGDLLGPIPFLAFVGRSAFHDQRIPEAHAGLVVFVVVDDRPGARAAEVRHGLLHEHGMQTAAPLLVDRPFARARFAAINGGAAVGAGSVLAELDEAGGVVVGSVVGRPLRHLLPGVAVLSTASVNLVVAVTDAARRLGPRRAITAAHDNALVTLEGQPALGALLADLPAAWRRRVGSLGDALFAAVDAGEADGEDGDGEAGGDDVLRAVTGFDPPRGAVALAERPPTGGAVTFALRDAAAARAALEECLTALDEALRDQPPLAFVVFGSAARDAGFLGAPLWDVTRVLSRFGPDIPVVGCTGRFEVAPRGAGLAALSHSLVVAALLPASG